MKRNTESKAAISPRIERALLGLTCFLSGGSVLIIELAGNRLLAPIFGNSLYTWTGLISIILLAISTGDYLGGWMVDRTPRFALISRVLFLAAGFVFLIPVIVPWVAARAVTGWSILWGPLLASLILFAVPAVLLATITPISIRLLSRTMGDQHIGLSAGTIGMLASLGSFCGTLLAGFILIPMIGVRQLYWVVAGILAILAILHLVILRDGKYNAVTMICAIFCGIGFLTGVLSADKRNPGIVFQKDDFYHRIQVMEQRVGEGKIQRILALDTTLEGGQIYPGGEILFPYQKYWQIAEACLDHVDHAVFFGAGAFAMPQHLSKRYPDANVDVVEIDPEVIKVGNRFFDLENYKKVVPHAEDARRFLSRAQDGSYDLVFGDAYNGVQYIPGHLLTREFFQIIDRKLTPKGIFAMNFIGALSGKKSELFQRVLATLQTVFPEVQVYALYPYNPEGTQNLILVASKEPMTMQENLPSELRALLHNRVDLPADRKLDTLTDNHCPIEYLIAQQIR